MSAVIVERTLPVWKCCRPLPNSLRANWQKQLEFSLPNFLPPSINNLDGSSTICPRRRMSLRLDRIRHPNTMRELGGPIKEAAPNIPRHRITIITSLPSRTIQILVSILYRILIIWDLPFTTYPATVAIKQLAVVRTILMASVCRRLPLSRPVWLGISRNSRRGGMGLVTQQGRWTPMRDSSLTSNGKCCLQEVLERRLQAKRMSPPSVLGTVVEQCARQSAIASSRLDLRAP